MITVSYLHSDQRIGSSDCNDGPTWRSTGLTHPRYGSQDLFTAGILPGSCSARRGSPCEKGCCISQVRSQDSAACQTDTPLLQRCVDCLTCTGTRCTSTGRSCVMGERAPLLSVNIPVFVGARQPSARRVADNSCSRFA